MLIINSNVTVEYLSFDIMVDEMVGGSNVHGDFLINGTIPPLVQQAPFQPMYLLNITTGNVLDTTDTMDTFSLFAFINISTGALAMPVSNVILHKIGKALSSFGSVKGTMRRWKPFKLCKHYYLIYYAVLYSCLRNHG